MDWDHDPEEGVYKIRGDQSEVAIIPEEVASRVKVVVPGLGRVPLSQVTPENSEGNQGAESSSDELSRSDMPEIPESDNLKTQADHDYYDRLVENPSSQVAQYRRLIYAEGRVSRPQFDDLAEQAGYNPDGGAHNASLLMLERIGEIDREGRGENQLIRWVGE